MKKRLLALLPFSAILIVGGVIYAQDNNQPATPSKPVATITVATSSTSEPVAPDTATTVEPTPPAVQTVVAQLEPTPTPTPQPTVEEQNKAKVTAIIEAKAATIPNADSNTTWRQTFCFDKIFTDSSLYGDYNAMINHQITQQYLYGLNGTYLYFSGSGTCSASYYGTN